LDAITDRVVDELKDIREMLAVISVGNKSPSLNKVREVVEIKIDRYIESQEARHQPKEQ
jgi:hypothetical protein